MAASVLVDPGLLVAFLNRRDANHEWAVAQARTNPPPWQTCEAVLSEAFYVLGPKGAPRLMDLLSRHAVVCTFSLRENLDDVIKLLRKYATVPMSLADACLVRMTEMLPDPILLSTDPDFRVYRRHSRHIVPCVLP